MENGEKNQLTFFKKNLTILSKNPRSIEPPVSDKIPQIPSVDTINLPLVAVIFILLYTKVRFFSRINALKILCTI